MHYLAELAVPKGRVAVHWFGQNSYAVKSPGGQLLLVDPYFPHERPAEKFIRPEPPVDEVALQPTAVLLTHDHNDHTNPETLQRLADGTKTVYVGPHESVRRLQDLGVAEERCTVIDAGDQVELGDCAAHAVYAKPPRGDPRRDIKPPDVTHLGIVLACGDIRLYWSGDAINTFAELDELVAPVRELAPQIGFLTTHPMEGEFPYFDGSVQMARRIGLTTAYPSHYDCFVKRTFFPGVWAAQFIAPDGPRPRIMGYNQTVLLP